MAWDFSITSTCKRAKIKSYIIECRIKEKKNDMIYAHNDIFYWLKTNYTNNFNTSYRRKLFFVSMIIYDWKQSTPFSTLKKLIIILTIGVLWNCFHNCIKAVITCKTVTTDLQLIYDTNVITAVRKANLRLVHDNRTMEVRFLRASHVASVIPSKIKIVRDTYDWHAKRPIVLCCNLNHFNAIFNAMISHVSHERQNSLHTHDHQTGTASCDRCLT